MSGGVSWVSRPSGKVWTVSRLITLVAWRLVKKNYGLVICNSPQRVYSLRGIQRRCAWAVGRLGVAAFWRASRRRRSTGSRDSLVVSGVLVWIGRLLWTCSDFQFSVGDSLELLGIHFTPPKRTRHRQDSFVVTGVVVWISLSLQNVAVVCFWSARTNSCSFTKTSAIDATI